MRWARDDSLIAELLAGPVADADAPSFNDLAERRGVLVDPCGGVEEDAAGQVTRQRMLNDLVLFVAADVA